MEPRKRSQPAVVKLVTPGWFYHAKQDKLQISPDKLRAVLDSKIWHYGVRQFELSKLRVSELRRIQGSFWNPTYVRGIFCLENSMPFFIEERKLGRLNAAIRREMSRGDEKPDQLMIEL